MRDERGMEERREGGREREREGEREGEVKDHNLPRLLTHAATSAHSIQSIISQDLEISPSLLCSKS